MICHSEPGALYPPHFHREPGALYPPLFHVSTFIQSGVNSSKVAKIVQPVDIKFFDPEDCEPLDL